MTRAAAPGGFPSLAADLKEAFTTWDGAPWPDGRFDELALRAFALQFETNAPYRAWCRARGAGPGTVRSWRDVPPVPTAAFRAVDLVAGPTDAAALTFLTSGTTGGAARRGRHLVLDPGLYRTSLRAAFRRFVLAGAPPVRILTLVPPPTAAPHSSLSWMLEDVRQAFGAPGSRCLAGAEGIDWAALAAALAAATADGSPVAVLGTTLALAAWADRREGATGGPPLPPGSLVMDTGGTKGRAGLDRDAVLDCLLPALGLDADRAVNEFGMTELLSQRYARGRGPGLLHGPPWLRTAALDPVSLAPRPDGEEGILCHWDLANAGSVLAVLTEDRGVVEDGTVRWLGRTPGAPPRGCSLATAELLAAQERQDA
ncbi:MAG: long-chain fatty acid--CoA ligase [Gemmatimonadota bacterium]|nr:long-chain fatty acid--CoA ligase [Gemmatimonadota bacterium]